MNTISINDSLKRQFLVMLILATALILPDVCRSQDVEEAKIIPPTSVESTFSENSSVILPEDYEYPELLGEGKSWIIWHGDAYDKQFGGSIRSDYFLYASVDGEEDIDGITCKRLKVTIQPLGGKCPGCGYGMTAETKYYYGYEQDRKIYFYRNPGYYQYLVYDEVLQENIIKIGEKDPYFDIFMDLNINIGDNVTDLGIIDKVEYKVIGSKKRRIVSSEWEDMPYLDYERNWIEGIGSNCDAAQWDIFHTTMVTGMPPLFNIMTDETKIRRYCDFLMVMCCENGVPIYDNRKRLQDYGIDLGTLSSQPTGINEIQSQNTTEFTDSKIYNLQGLEVTNPQKGQFYIHNGIKILYTD